MTTALVQLDTRPYGPPACYGYTTLSGSAVCQVVVTASAGSASAAADAQALHAHIALALGRQHAQRHPTPCDDDFGPGADGCWAGQHAGPVRRTLVWVVDASGAPPVVPLQPAHARPWTTIVPVLPNGVSPPGQAGTSVALPYALGNVAAAVPGVLTAAGLSADAFRIFISYRHDDARAFADQLFGGLSKQGFDVYLDRFSTAPGTNFVERIRSELADKACVVLLDSRDIRKSAWVEGEYAFARLYKLGLMAIDLPGGRKTFHRIGTRCDLRRRVKRTADFTGSTELTSRAVDVAVQFVRDNYHREVARRFRHQRDLVRHAAALAGVSTMLRPDGLVEITHPHDYILCVSARPPGPEEFRRACEAARRHRPRPCKGVVVGPLAAQMHQSRETTTWLARVAGAAAVNELRLFKALERAKRRRL